MAWRSSGTTNDEMVDNLKQNGIISSSAVEQGFRNVNRRFFVPKGGESMAYVDQPLREDDIHLSAPHIYGSALEALELRSDTSLTFLNVGSGTGYVTAIVASILGPHSSCHGVEIRQTVVRHCQEATARWKKQYRGKLPLMQTIHGNGLHIVPDKGESALGYDRIYIGASIGRDDLSKLTTLLKPGGILVGPVDDELVKVFRIRKSDDSMGVKSDDFSRQVLSGVRFSSLLPYPATKTVIPSSVWEPAVHHLYPDSFRNSTRAIMLCGNSQFHQPPPPQYRPQQKTNLAATLPRVIWLEILSFTHRHWFEPAEVEESFLRQRLAEERENTRRAQEARAEAEARCQMMERERDVFRLLARRWQSRLQVLLHQQRRENGGSTEAVEEIMLGGREEAVIFGLGRMLRGLQSDSEAEDDGEEEESDREMDEEMGNDDDDDVEEEDISDEMTNHNNNLANIVHLDDEDSDDDENYDFSEDETSDVGSSSMAGTNSSKALVLRPQIRTVSMSGEDF